MILIARFKILKKIKNSKILFGMKKGWNEKKNYSKIKRKLI